MFDIIGPAGPFSHKWSGQNINGLGEQILLTASISYRYK